MTIEERLDEKKEQLKEIEKKKAYCEGKIEEIEKTLLEEFNIKKDDSIEVILTNMKKDLKKLENEITKELDELDKEWEEDND